MTKIFILSRLVGGEPHNLWFVHQFHFASLNLASISFQLSNRCVFQDVVLTHDTQLLELVKQLQGASRRECLKILDWVCSCGLSCSLPSKSSPVDTGTGKAQIEPIEPPVEPDTALRLTATQLNPMKWIVQIQ